MFLRGRGDDARAVLVAASGDLRAFAMKRLAGNGPRVDLAAVTDEVRASETGSGFEADWARWVLSSRLAPSEPGMRPSGGAFVSLEPAGDVPACRVVGLVDRAGADPGTLIGPFGRRSAADAFARLLDDRFELCREPSLLARRPGAIACPYKEMGKCPAPCDGSEPMEAYRERVRAALEFAKRPVDIEVDSIRMAIEEATAALEFEWAASLKDELAALGSVRGAAFAWATTLDRFGVLAVLPSGRSGWARLVVHRAGENHHLADVDAGRAGEAIDACRDRLTAACGPWTITPGADESIGLVCRYLFAKRKTRSTFLRLDPPPGRDAVLRAIRRAAKVDVDEPSETTGAEP